MASFSDNIKGDAGWDLVHYLRTMQPMRTPEATIWKAWLVIRAWLTGTKLRPLYDNPETRKLLKPEAQWEVEEGYKISAYDRSAAAAVRNAWYNVMRELFQRYDYLTMPSASVFPFSVDTHWPAEIAGQKMGTYHQWRQVMIPVTIDTPPQEL